MSISLNRPRFGLVSQQNKFYKETCSSTILLTFWAWQWLANTNNKTTTYSKGNFMSICLNTSRLVIINFIEKLFHLQFFWHSECDSGSQTKTTTYSKGNFMSISLNRPRFVLVSQIISSIKKHAHYFIDAWEGKSSDHKRRRPINLTVGIRNK